MLGKRYSYFHGWVEEIQFNPSNGECLLTMRLGSVQAAMLTVSSPGWLLEPGNEVSVAVERGKPSHVVALVDHTAGDGAILLCPERRLNREDVVIAAALLILTLLVSDLKGLPVFALTMMLYWLTTAWFPGAIRRRDMVRIGYLIDRDYRRWLEARDGQ